MTRVERQGEPIELGPDLAELAERAFNAYNEQGPNPWRTFDGRPVPRWSEVTDQVREKWKAATRELLRCYPVKRCDER